MKGAFRQSMGWLHTWGGLSVGWILFFMFLTGTLGYFDTEIDRWMQPERPLTRSAITADRAAALAVDRLRRDAPDAEGWRILLPYGREVLDLRLFWRARPAAPGEQGAIGFAVLDPETGDPVRYRDTGGGNLLYEMHYRLHYLPSGFAYWVVGLCAMLMFVAILTGVIVHKRIFRDLFTFRPGPGQRSWLDAHNALAVFALPFHVMITWSGLVFFMSLYMAPVISATYGTAGHAQEAFFDELLGHDDIPGQTGRPAVLVALDAPIARAESAMGAGEVRRIDIHHPGGVHARIVIAGGPLTPTGRQTELTFDGTTGALIRETGPRSAASATWQSLLALHEGLFAGPVLRWLYFLSGIAGTAMIGAGLVLWTAKRRPRIGEAFGFRLVERLNIGTIAGLPVAIAAYFWANRLIPVGIEGRAAWEAHSMFAVWAALLGHAFLRPTSRGWREQLWLAAAAFGLLPLLNALTTDRHLGVTLAAGAWDLAGFDLTALVCGTASAAAAWRVTPRPAG